MKNAQRRAKMSGYFLFTIISCLALFGCEDPGLVGSGFTDTNTSVKVDSMQVSDLGLQALTQYSGRLAYFSSGRFDDPLFGDLEAVGLIKPGLSASDDDTMQEEANMKLRLIINQEEVYGDSTAPAEFDLVELDQVWRGKAWKLHDPVQLSSDPPVASFTIDRQNSINIPLSTQWIQKYRDFFESEASNRDSLYRIQFPGLAVVPKNSTKIVPFDADSSRFIIENPDEDTLRIIPADWAYSLNRDSPQPAPEGTFKTHSTLENVINFDMQLDKEALGTVNISRVELVLYENSELLANSLNPGVQRPEITNGYLHLVEPQNVPIALDPGSPLVQGQYNPADRSFRFNLTSFVNGVLLDGVTETLKFYMTVQTNNGIVRSSLIYNDRAPASKKPKIIVTSIQNETEEGTN